MKITLDRKEVNEALVEYCEGILSIYVGQENITVSTIHANGSATLDIAIPPETNGETSELEGAFSKD